MSTDNIQHVLPVNDIIPHTEFCNDKGICKCDCKPERKEIFEPTLDGKGKLVGIVIVHNSFDGREGVEWAKEIIG